ncbi:hypothetical protein BS50DRAFT_578570 [Corynespora cassiicola Philippines]|uniref:Uncharacterized protein n=1 Tax=Corynespora cassiicola Philippines TaxID=1448308 RepID=A0A2T2N6T2_CORCC|nr:hypothetical protein BS50DRAFT_578570 [Corynespora cassiicola Philippines]
MLPRIKYRNPTIPIQISRHKDAAGPSLLHIYTSSLANPTTPAASSTTTAPPTGVPETATPTHIINIKDKHESEILDLLVEKLRPRVVEPSQEELDEIQAIKDFKVGAEKDRVLVREKLERERREAELLRLARGEVPQAN